MQQAIKSPTENKKKTLPEICPAADMTFCPVSTVSFTNDDLRIVSSCYLSLQEKGPGDWICILFSRLRQTLPSEALNASFEDTCRVETFAKQL